MGYDMYTVEDPRTPEQLAEVESLLAERDLIYKTHGTNNLSDAAKEQVGRIYDRLEELDQAVYFRLNIWGMAEVRDLMAMLGIIDVDAPHPDFQSLPEGLDEDEIESLDEDEIREREALLLEGMTESKLVPWYKLSSNSGWLVTPEECKNTYGLFQMCRQVDPLIVPPDQTKLGMETPMVQALTGDDYLTPPTELHLIRLSKWIEEHEYQASFLGWMKHAADLGGFRVY